jgi:hypothetical protein
MDDLILMPRAQTAQNVVLLQVKFTELLGSYSSSVQVKSITETYIYP